MAASRTSGTASASARHEGRRVARGGAARGPRRRWRAPRRSRRAQGLREGGGGASSLRRPRAPRPPSRAPRRRRRHAARRPAPPASAVRPLRRAPTPPNGGRSASGSVRRTLTSMARRSRSLRRRRPRPARRLFAVAIVDSSPLCRGPVVARLAAGDGAARASPRLGRRPRGSAGAGAAVPVGTGAVDAEGAGRASAGARRRAPPPRRRRPRRGRRAAAAACARPRRRRLRSGSRIASRRPSNSRLRAMGSAVAGAPRPRAAVEDVEQVAGVVARAGAAGEHEVVAGALALGAQAPRGHPHQRMEPVGGAGQRARASWPSRSRRFTWASSWRSTTRRRSSVHSAASAGSTIVLRQAPDANGIAVRSLATSAGTSARSSRSASSRARRRPLRIVEGPRGRARCAARRDGPAVRRARRAPADDQPEKEERLRRRRPGKAGGSGESRPPSSRRGRRGSGAGTATSRDARPRARAGRSRRPRSRQPRPGPSCGEHLQADGREAQQARQHQHAREGGQPHQVARSGRARCAAPPRPAAPATSSTVAFTRTGVHRSGRPRSPPAVAGAFATRSRRRRQLGFGQVRVGHAQQRGHRLLRRPVEERAHDVPQGLVARPVRCSPAGT